jgi:hypothetical protein
MTNKYGAQAVTIDGITFGSKLEARRWCELKLMEAAGDISHLSPHPRYDLRVNGVLIGHYTGDSEYCTEAGEVVCEDVKSSATRTRDYILRRKLMLACHGIEVSEYPPKPPPAQKPRKRPQEARHGVSPLPGGERLANREPEHVSAAEYRDILRRQT